MTAHESDTATPTPGRCSSCKAAILWVRMASGKVAPFDAEPTPSGQWQIDINGVAVRVGTGRDMFAPPARYNTHFATCPQADQHRRPR